jgi:hypothetical protein
MTFSVQKAIATVIEQLENEMSDLSFEVTAIHLGVDMHEKFWEESDSTDIDATIVEEWMLQPDEWFLQYSMTAETGVFNLAELEDSYARRNVVNIFG